jgi:hypothetical protein
MCHCTSSIYNKDRKERSDLRIVQEIEELFTESQDLAAKRVALGYG